MTTQPDSETTTDETDDHDTVQTCLSEFTESPELRTDGGTPDDDSENDTTDDDNMSPTDDDSNNVESGSEPAADAEPDSSSVRQTDGPSPPATLTPNVREVIYLSRGNECELCGADGTDPDVSLHIHHRDEQANGGTNHPDNLCLLCEQCHNRHHGTTPAPRPSVAAETHEESPDQHAEEDEEGSIPEEPLPPKSSPNNNGTATDVLAVIEKHGPVRTGDIAAQVDHTEQTVRRVCWKLCGEQLAARTTDREWELRERVGSDDIVIGLPDDPKKAKRAGRDEVIRQMSAHNMSHTEIAEITGLSRQTVSVAVDRARALRIDATDTAEVGYPTIARRLTALVDLLDHAHDQTIDD